MGLQAYKQKRDFKRTPEPEGRRATGEGYSFVVQKHDASRLHYDFRLELEGVLLSWAVPKGPSLDPKVKRLAVQVEDHPLEYSTFEGTIPQGEYGGGTVMVWDRGRWIPRGENAQQDYKAGKLKFTLEGEKLQGDWMLLRSGSRQNNGQPHWLLIKERDAAARPEAEGDILEQLPLSAASGRTLEEIAAGQPPRKRAARKPRSKTKAAGTKTATSPRTAAAPRKGAVSRRLAKLPGARQGKLPQRVDAQLASLAKQAPAGNQWLHEMKYDGYRMFCRLDQGNARFISRNQQDWTTRLSALVPEVARLDAGQAVLDGEVVVLDKQGVSSFQALQNAFTNRGGSPLVYFVFDLLYLDGYDLTATPLLERKSVLEPLLKSGPAKSALRYSEHIQGSGAEFLEQACRAKLEGVISKRADSPYTPGRSTTWLKSKCRQGQEFVVGGFTDPAGSRFGFGSLLVGYHQAEGELVYAGRVGTGFDDRLLRDLHVRLKQLEQPKSPFINFPPRRVPVRHHWVRPELVAQIEFANWTDEGLLRQAAFLGLREDKSPQKVVKEEPAPATRMSTLAKSNGRARKASKDNPKSSQLATPKLFASSVAARRRAPRKLGLLPEVRLTHAERVLYPEQGITKHDVATYYAQVADWMLPHIANRPLALVRCPDGVTGSCFFQKHPPQGMSEAVERIKVREKTETDTYLVVHNVEGLIGLVQFGALELHAWGSRADDLERPDRVVFDLDPDPSVPWSEVVDTAFLMRSALEEFELTSFVKTTGGKGLHVVVPLVRKHSWAEAKQFTKAVAELLANTAPDRYLATMSKTARRGKIFIDYLRNDRGSTAVAAYSTRARSGASVSTPLDWEELPALAGPADYTVENVPQRLASLRKDPWQGLAGLRQSITAATKKKLRLK